MNDPELDRLIRDLGVPKKCQAFLELPTSFLSDYSVEDSLALMMVNQDWEGLRKAGMSISALKVIGEAVGTSIFEIAASMSRIDIAMSIWLLGEIRAETPLFTIWP